MRLQGCLRTNKVLAVAPAQMAAWLSETAALCAGKALPHATGDQGECWKLEQRCAGCRQQASTTVSTLERPAVLGSDWRLPPSFT